MKKIINICLVLLLITIQYSCKSESEKKTERVQELLEQVNRFCDEQEFGKAHTAANKILAIYKPESRYDWAKEELLTCYFAAEDVIFTRESQYLIAHIDEKDAIDKICYLLTGLPSVGTFYPEGTYVGITGPENEAEDYSRWTSWYNQKCDALLSLAIGLGNEGFAKRIIPLFKDDYTISTYKVQTSNKTKTAAKQKYAEAFNNNIL